VRVDAIAGQDLRGEGTPDRAAISTCYPSFPNIEAG
jgi:hypothetical protein